ncbi:MAG: hypothetical protein FWH08_03115 [Oscillospiraceae bacterium]|nr:hypothetical protein [Oscillospiraceae bacterium]
MRATKLTGKIKLGKFIELLGQSAVEANDKLLSPDREIPNSFPCNGAFRAQKSVGQIRENREAQSRPFQIKKVKAVFSARISAGKNSNTQEIGEVLLDFRKRKHCFTCEVEITPLENGTFHAEIKNNFKNSKGEI